MSTSVSPKSLISWLNKKNNVYLELYSKSADNTESEEKINLISNTNPFVRTIDCKLCNFSGEKIRNYFLIQQKSAYEYASNILEDISNNVIDEYWQNLHCIIRSEDYVGKIINFKSADDDNQSLEYYRSLFYCKNKGIYFHPVCSACGALLEQYYREDPYTEAGIHPYSSSLRRYLFCTNCGSSNYYVYQREDSDPSFVVDRHGLIDSYSNLVFNQNTKDSSLPCLNCDCKDECFGSGSLASSRIETFSFYNFYMLGFESSELHSFDFLALVSGASFEDIRSRPETSLEPGRITGLSKVSQTINVQDSFFFKGTDNWFLEILFLKLNYLLQLSRVSLSENALKKYSDLELSFDQFWIDFSTENNNLPNLWNFTVKPLGICFPTAGVSSSFAPAALRLHSFVLIWFSALLSNSQQSISDVRKFLISIREQADPELPLDYETHPLLAAENIFWFPRAQKLSDLYQMFWRRALEKGWELFNVCLNPSTEFQAEVFLAELKQLSDEVKDALFIPSAPNAVATKPAIDNRHLLEIIDEIKGRWLAAVDQSTPEGAEKLATDSGIEAVAGIEANEDLDKTVIMQAEKQQLESTSTAELEDTDKTVLLSVPEQSEKPVSEPPDATDTVAKDNDHLDETVILNPEELADRMKPRRHD